MPGLCMQGEYEKVCQMTKLRQDKDCGLGAARGTSRVVMVDRDGVAFATKE